MMTDEEEIKRSLIQKRVRKSRALRQKLQPASVMMQGNMNSSDSSTSTCEPRIKRYRKSESTAHTLEKTESAPNTVETLFMSSSQELKQYMASEFQSIQNNLSKILTELEELKAMIRNIYPDSRAALEKPNLLSMGDYNIEFPLKTMEHFKTFETILSMSEMPCEKMVKKMWLLADVSNPVTITVRDIFKRFISRDVLMNYTAVKETGKKEVFKNTKFFSVMQAAILAKFVDKKNMPFVTEKQIEQAVGRVLNNVKYYDGILASRWNK